MDNPIPPDVYRVLSDILCDLAGSSVRIDSLEQWGIGALNDCWKVQTLHPRACYFVKMERAGIRPSTRRGQVAREVSAITLSAAAGLRVPAILAYDVSTARVGRSYLVEDFIEGDLFWEIRERLTDAECDLLRADMTRVLETMQSITAPYFGDPFPAGPVGQHPSWRAASQSAVDVLLEDCRAMQLFSPPQESLVQRALSAALEQLISTLRPGLYHGDLGLHNVLVDSSTGCARLGTIIDFGNAIFAPFYRNDQDTRLYGGFGLDPTDVTARYGVSPAEQDANRLIGELEMFVFRAMLHQHRHRPLDDLRDAFLAQCQAAPA